METAPFTADMRHINRRDDVRKNARLRRSQILLQVRLDSTNSAEPPFGTSSARVFHSLVGLGVRRRRRRE
jgi:hypothetical protein